MNFHDESVKNCFSFGHLYISTFVQRCPHLESYVWRVAVWRDEDDSEPTILFEEGEELGPFDSLDYLQNQVASATVRALHLLATAAVPS